METESGKPLRFAARRIKRDALLIITTTAEPGVALKGHKKRWVSECLFGDARTHGYRAKTGFRARFNQLRKRGLYEPPPAIQAWSRILPGRERVA